MHGKKQLFLGCRTLGERLSVRLHTFQQCCYASYVVKHKANNLATSVRHQVSQAHLCSHCSLKTLFIILFPFLYALFYFHFLICKCITANVNEKKLLEKEKNSEITKGLSQVSFEIMTQRDSQNFLVSDTQIHSYVLFAFHK